MSTLLLVVLVVLLVAAAPGLRLHTYGWGPSGVIALLVVILIVLLLTGRL